MHDRLVHYREITKNEQARVNHFVEEVTFGNGTKAWLPQTVCTVGKSGNFGIQIVSTFGSGHKGYPCKAGVFRGGDQRTGGKKLASRSVKHRAKLLTILGGVKMSLKR